MTRLAIGTVRVTGLRAAGMAFTTLMSAMSADAERVLAMELVEGE